MSDGPTATGRVNAGGQTLHRLADRGGWELWRPSPARPQKPTRVKLPPATVAAYLEQCRQQLTPARAAELAAELGVAIPAAAGLGWDSAKGAWTLPWRDGAGIPVGAFLRLPESSGVPADRRKQTLQDTRLGLAYLPPLADRDGTVWVVEGWSDTLALESVGLSALGRPSVNAALDAAAEFLADAAAERVVVVLERDQKPDGRWPGRDLGLKYAAALAAMLGRRVDVCLPPGDFKDSRAAIVAGVDAAAWQAGVEWLPSVGVELTGGDCTAPVVGLAEYRAELLDRRTASLETGGVFVDMSPPGSGKSFADRQLLAAVGGLLVLPTHLNCQEEAAKLSAANVQAVAGPELVVLGVDTDDAAAANCRNQAAAIARELGLPHSRTVCGGCPYGRPRTDPQTKREMGGDGSCAANGYQAQAAALKESPVKVVTHARAVQMGLADLAAGAGYVAVHENALDVLVPEWGIDAESLGEAERILERQLNQDGLNAKRSEEQTEVLNVLADIVAELRVALDAGENARVATPAMLPGMANLVYRLLFTVSRNHYGKRRASVDWRPLLQLLAGARAAVVVGHRRVAGGAEEPVAELKVFGWNPPPSSPGSPPVWLGDGTADLVTLRRLVPNVVDGTPACRLPVRTRVRQLSQSDIKESSSPARVVKVLAGLLADNPNYRRVGVVCWKKHRAAIEAYQQAGGLGDRVAMLTHFGSGADRASNQWIEGVNGGPPCDVIVVLGSPRKGEAAVRGHLMRVGLLDAAGRPTPSWGAIPWRGLTESGDTRLVNGLGYSDPEWQAAARWLCRSALVQAIGRARPQLADGLDAVVCSSEECGALLSETTTGPELNAGVSRLLAALGGADENRQHPYRNTSREVVDFPLVADLAKRLGVDDRTVSRWLTLAERRGLVVPVRNGVAVPGRGRGRGTRWRLVPPAADLEGGTMATPPPELPVGVSSLALGRGVTFAETPPELRVGVADVTPANSVCQNSGKQTPSPAHTPPPPSSPVPTGAATSCWWDRPLPEPPEPLDWLDWALDEPVAGAVGPAEEARRTAPPGPETNGRTEGGAEGRGRPQT